MFHLFAVDVEIDSLKYEDACGSLIIHDIMRPDTLKFVCKWKQFVDNNILLPNGDPIPCILLANKVSQYNNNNNNN